MSQTAQAFKAVLCTLMLAAPALSMGSDAELKSAPEPARRETARAARPLPLTDADWSHLAGDYFFGDGFETNCSLQLPGNGRFSFQLEGVSGTYQHIEGTVNFRKNSLVLIPTSGYSKPFARGFYQEMLPIAWGERMYLIPSNNIIGFINSINRGSEPASHGSHGKYYMREGDWDREATGLPDLPKEWQGYILSQPIQTRIVGKNKTGQWKVDAGRNAGLYPRMELFAIAPGKDALATLRVVSVEGNLAYATQIVSEKPLDLSEWSVSSQAAFAAGPNADEVVRNADAEVPSNGPGTSFTH